MLVRCVGVANERFNQVVRLALPRLFTVGFPILSRDLYVTLVIIKYRGYPPFNARCAAEGSYAVTACAAAIPICSPIAVQFNTAVE